MTFALADDRYARHRLIDGWDQDRLETARFVVAGAGAVGNEVLKLLAMAGARHFVVVDPDRVERTNLTRTVLFRDEDVGDAKAAVAARRLVDLNPEAQVRPVVGWLQAHLSLLDLAEADLVFGCLDNVEARVDLGSMARMAGVPWLDAAIDAWAAMVALYQPDEGPCYACQVTPEGWERLGRRYSCTGLRTAAPERPAGTTAVMASLAAGLQVSEGLKVLFGHPGRLAAGQRLVLNTSPPGLQVYHALENPDCVAHASRLSVSRTVEVEAGTRCRELMLEGLELRGSWVISLDCHSCGASERVLRPARSLDVGVVACGACGSDREVVLASRVEAGDGLAETPILTFLPAGRDILRVDSQWTVVQKARTP